MAQGQASTRFYSTPSRPHVHRRTRRVGALRRHYSFSPLKCTQYPHGTVCSSGTLNASQTALRLG